MKQLFSVSLFICFFQILTFAQQQEGIISFEEKMNLHRNLPEDAADMKAMMPEFRTQQNELLFNATESLYRNVEEEEEDEGFGDNQGMVIKMQRPEALYYRNFAEKRKVDQREFMRKEYLITDSIGGQTWKITGETKKILEYNCMGAVTSDTARKQEITAWFAPDLPLPTGPASYGELPGTILELDINDGEIVISAKKVTFKKLKKKDIKEPSSGEKITQAEFQALIAERMKEFGGGGRRMRVIRN
ncbi:MAG: GLPGLI family protein [Saprospiraceae bacterium]|nr:GLPGLI family protein [Saprospiraceae bacterium]MCB9343602.1 GLPGLI family protein [Lewinellaceae bacterium]